MFEGACLFVLVFGVFLIVCFRLAICEVFCFLGWFGSVLGLDWYVFSLWVFLLCGLALVLRCCFCALFSVLRGYVVNCVYFLWLGFFLYL